VELLTALMFLACWNSFGRQSVWLVLALGLLISGLITATFIDFEHFIIPDEITIGGIGAGFLCALALPQMLGQTTRLGALKESLLGIGVGAGLIYAILRLGKLLFGRQRLALTAKSRLIFTETALYLPDREIPFEELFYRRSDAITLHAEILELVDRCYRDVRVRLSPHKLQIGDEEFDPEQVPHMEAVSAAIVLPREAMGLGDVKFMAAIGAFIGWQAVIFALMVSSMIGSVVGVTLIALGKREWSSRLPYGPYIAMAATIWIFFGPRLMDVLFGGPMP